MRDRGDGHLESTTRHDYGQVPAGQYRLSVTGRDYESRVETVRVERGKVLAFAPELRYTTEYLGAKYGAQLDRLRKVADGKIVSQADLEEAEILARKIEAEGRPGLAAFAARVETLRATLASLRPAPAPAPAAAVPAAALPAAAAASGKATGTFTFNSDPPGAKIAIDGGEPVPMPVSLELPPVPTASSRCRPRSRRPAISGRPSSGSRSRRAARSASPSSSRSRSPGSPCASRRAAARSTSTG